MPRFLAAQSDTRLITLPWETPLENWPEEILVALPRGISRHVVRFVRVGKEVYALKEVMEHLESAGFRLAGIEPALFDPETAELLQADAIFVRD